MIDEIDGRFQEIAKERDIMFAIGEEQMSIAEDIVNGIKKNDVPYITDEGNERFISRIKNGTLIGFKYFDFQGKTEVSVQTRGNGVGKLLVMNHQDSVLIEIPISASETWRESPFIEFHALGKQGLFFQYVGRGSLDMLCFNLK